MLDVTGLTTAAGACPDVSLDRGACIAVTGPSGSGKSLMLRAIADLDPAPGEVRLDDRPRESWSAPEWRRQVMYVAAESGFWAPTLAGTLPARPEAGQAEAFGLRDGALDDPIERLSTGERQRGALLRALMAKPRVLLLDEPTGPLDSETTERIEAVLRRFLDDGGAILLVTHDREQAGRLGHKQIRMGQ